MSGSAASAASTWRINARALVNDLERYPHAFVLACIADRQTKADIAWGLPYAIREAASGFDLDTLLRLPKGITKKGVKGS
ncbi:hypothetical protein [Candidatus Palauibacter sp.]|uniref:hypothetical protein n=1 Tax=Candidatus Palauibacter sp. TaxID=3101350 RepID=UPI003B0212D9